MLFEISTIIFPGTDYNTVIAIMPDYLCNILLQGSEDLSLDENKKKSMTAYLHLSMTLGVSITMRLSNTTKIALI